MPEDATALDNVLTVEHLRTEFRIEGAADVGCLVAHLVLDRAVALQQIGARHRFAGDVDADGAAERLAVVQHAQEAALVAAIVEDRRRVQVVRHGDIDHAPPDRRMRCPHRLFVSGVAVPGCDRRGLLHRLLPVSGTA
jgi:hypothetical protein